MRQLLKSPDPYAVLVGVVIQAAVLLDLVKYLNLTVDESFQLGGLGLIAAGAIRTIVTRRHKVDSTPPTFEPPKSHPNRD